MRGEVKSDNPRFKPRFLLFVFAFVFFLGLHPQHMEVPRLGVTLELHLRPTALAHSQARSVTQ